MTDAELTILSLLAEAPRYGHELEQIIEERGLREWMTIGFASIYYLLNKLERQELLTSELRPDTAGPARKLYQLSEAGRGVLQTAVIDLLRQPRALGTGFELGLTNLDVLKPAQVYQTLSNHRGDLRQRLEAVERAWTRHQHDGETPNYLRALYTHSISMMRAELNWLNLFLDDWLKRYPGSNKSPTKPTRDDNPHTAPTLIHRRLTPAPAKLIQRIRRPPKKE